MADAAYTHSVNLIIPYTGAAQFDTDKDTFNYYLLSQLRFCVDMTFGHLVNKFQILHEKVEGSLD